MANKEVLEGPGSFQPDGQITVEIKFLTPAIFSSDAADPSFQLPSRHITGKNYGLT